MRFNLPRKAIYNLLYRQEMTCRSRDFFTMREVCRHLSLRESTVLSWIEAGLLTAEQSTRRDGRVLYAFSHEALAKFCKQSRELLLKRSDVKGKKNHPPITTAVELRSLSTLHTLLAA